MSGYIEVKSRKLGFNSDPDSFPMPTAFVDTVSGWRKKEKLPLAIVLVSQMTGKILVVPVTTSSNWKTIKSFDRKRKIEDLWYTVSKDLLKEYKVFLDWLIKRQENYSQIKQEQK